MSSADPVPRFPRPSMFVGRDDVRLALAAGFTADDVAYMLDCDLDEDGAHEAMATLRPPSRPIGK